MFRPSLALFLTLSLLTGAAATQTKPGPSPLGGELPTIGTVGTTPTQHRFPIELHHNGLLSVAGVPVTFDECFAKLADHRKSVPGLRIGGVLTSLANIVIRADQSVPLASIDRMLRECARHDIAAPRIFFGARQQASGEEGAFAYFLPIDRGDDVAHEVVPVTAMPGEPGSIQGLENYLRRYLSAMEPDQQKRACVRIRARGDLAWGQALQLLDAAARAGVGAAYLDCQLTPEQGRCWLAESTRRDLRALQLASPTTSEVGCKIGPVTVLEGTPTAPPKAVRDGLAGYATSPRGLAIREVPVEEEEVGEIETGEIEIDGPREEGIGGSYRNRVGAARGKQHRPQASQAIDDGLLWLTQHQDEDGKWDADGFMKHDRAADGVPGDGAGNPVHDVGVTGLALLALLGDGNTMRSGPYRDQVKRAVKWLRDQQHHNGMFGSNASHDFIYDHAIATYAMVEAYGLSNYKLIKPTAQKALNYLEAHRNPYSVWRYQPRDGDNDTSVTNWCALAYAAGKDFGLEVNPTALETIASWLDEVADPATGRHGYSKRGEPSSRHPGDHIKRFPLGKNEALTGSSLFVRYMLGQNMEKNPIMRKAADLIHSLPPAWTPRTGNIDLYAWYWCSQAMHQVGGRHWQNWSQHLTRALLTGQDKTGPGKGSWAPIGVWGEDGGRVASTALATLSLQSYYRYGRLVR